MESRSIGDLAHPWKVSQDQAKEIQSKLSPYISLKDDFDEVEKIAGIGISFSKNQARISAVEFSFPKLAIKNQFSKKERIDFPYLPNFFAFSVGPIILSIMEKVKKPYIALFPGRAIAHPRGLGLASHLGLLLDIPTIACSKTALWKKYPQIDLKKGNCDFIRDSSGNIQGAVVVTKDDTKPVFVSSGAKEDGNFQVNNNISGTQNHSDVSSNGTYTYFVWQDSRGGNYDIYAKVVTWEWSEVENDKQKDIAEKFSLGQNYPNPFNPQTFISFYLKQSGKVSIKIYNILGQKVRDLEDNYYQRGKHKITWDGKDNNRRDVSTGVYFYQLKSANFSQVKKMVLLR